MSDDASDGALLWSACRALHPDDSIALTARDLGMDPRTLKRMTSGAIHNRSGAPWRVPPGLWCELATLLDARAADLASRMRARGGP